MASRITYQRFSELLTNRSARLDHLQALTVEQRTALLGADKNGNRVVDNAELRDLFTALGGREDLDLMGASRRPFEAAIRSIGPSDADVARLVSAVSSNGSLGHAPGPVLPVGAGFGLEVEGGNYENGRAMVVTGATGGVHLVKNAFYRLYASPSPSAGYRPLHDVLGRPKGPEYAVDGGARQDFEGGHLLWTQEKGAWPVLNAPVIPSGPPADITAALTRRIGNYAALGTKSGAPVQLGGGWAQWMSGAHFGGGRALIASGDKPGSAFAVVNGFLEAYTANHAQLGRPKSDEYGSNGGARQDFEKGYTTWTPAGGVQVHLNSAPAATSSLRAAQPGQVLADGSRIVSLEQLQSTAAVTVTRGSVTRMVEFEIRPGAGPHGTPKIEGAPPHAVTLPTITLTNKDGTALTFLSDGQLGGRLLQATVRDAQTGALKPIFYENQTPRRTQWGPELPGGGTQGWVGVGGVEVGFGPNEHGTYNATKWDVLARVKPDGSIGFISRTQTDPNDTFTQKMGVAVETMLSANGRSFQINHEVANLEAGPIAPQYWINFMVPAGSDNHLDDIELNIPGDGRALVHSAGDQDQVREFESIVLRNHGGRDLRHMNTNVRSWLGIFGMRSVPQYSIRNHDRDTAVSITSRQGDIYPKFFVAPGFSPGEWTRDGSRYNEMWFSPFNQTFWNNDELTAHGVQGLESKNLFAAGETKNVSYTIGLD